MKEINSISEAYFDPDLLSILDLNNGDLRNLKGSEVQAAREQAAYHFIIRAIDLALCGDVDAVVTSPFNKKALHLVGIPLMGILNFSQSAPIPKTR